MGGVQDLSAGSILGRYELVLRIAKGGMGEVWAARLHGSRGFHKLVALKTLLPELSQDPNFEQMFLDEASLTAKIKHPNVVEVIDLGDQDAILFQAMEWVEGASLWAIMRAAAKRKTKLPLLVAASVVRQAAAGLHAAHELKDLDGNPLGLVHRDVSPQNVLVTPQGVAKVVDFGVARFTGRSSMATQTGELRGKVPYMAPEAILAQPIDRRADVFALGLMLYQAASGVHPFMGENDTLTLSRIVEPQPPRPLIELVPEVPPALSDLVDRALKKSPADRVPTAAQFAREIEKAMPAAASDEGREAVADFCNGLGPEYFPARVRELRDALKRLDGGVEKTGAFARPSLYDINTNPRTPTASNPSLVPSQPSLIPSQPSPVSSQTPPAVASPESQPSPSLALPPVQRTGSRAWMAVGGALVVVGALIAAFALGGSQARSAEAGRRDPRPATSAPAETPSAVASVSASPPAATSATADAPPPVETAPAVISATPPVPTFSARPFGSAKAWKRDKDKKPQESAGEFKPGGI